jgi:hypothetical protein
MRVRLKAASSPTEAPRITLAGDRARCRRTEGTSAVQVELTFDYDGGGDREEGGK